LLSYISIELVACQPACCLTLAACRLLVCSFAARRPANERIRSSLTQWSCNQ